MSSFLCSSTLRSLPTCAPVQQSRLFSSFLSINSTSISRSRPSIIATTNNTAAASPGVSTFRQQVRYKHKIKESKTIFVELLQPVDGYGKAGTVIAAPRGLMRNRWYPGGLAAYISPPKLKELKVLELAGEVGFGRDPSFNTAQHLEQMTSDKLKRATMADVPTPARTREIIENILSPGLIFHRPAITSVLTRDASNMTSQDVPERTPIYGSVSTADVAKSIMSELMSSSFEEAPRITVSSQDVVFLSESNDPEPVGSNVTDRLRRTGTYDISVKVRVPRQFATTHQAVNPVKTKIKIVHEDRIEEHDNTAEGQTSGAPMSV